MPRRAGGGAKAAGGSAAAPAAKRRRSSGSNSAEPAAAATASGERPAAAAVCSMPPGLQQSATQRVSQCLLSTMCSQREEPTRQMSQAQEDDLRGFYDQLMRRLQADGWAEGWSAVKSQILEVVVELNRLIDRASPRGGAGSGAAGGGAAGSGAAGRAAGGAGSTRPVPVLGAEPTASMESLSGEAAGCRPRGRSGAAAAAADSPRRTRERRGAAACAAPGPSSGGGGGGGDGSGAGFEFLVSGTGPRTSELQAAGSGSVLCGRFGLCDIVVGHEKRGGVEGENLLIGRVQFIALRTAHEVAIFDCWSKCGTRTVERSDGRAPLLSSRPGSRRVLLFAPGERFVLEVGETARVTFNPRAAAA